MNNELRIYNGGKIKYSPLLKDKEASRNFYISYMLNRLQSMFKWNGLPDTIPQTDMELLLQCEGYCAFTYVDHEGYSPTANSNKKFPSGYYVFGGGLGGFNPYYKPTFITVANSAMVYSKSLVFDEDCVLIKNDSLYMGLMPMLGRYAEQLVDNDISMWLCDIVSRIQIILAASDNATIESAQKYIKDIYDGKIGTILEPAFIEELAGIKSIPVGQQNTNTLKDLIEYHQYLKAGLFNDVGLNANYNMKREALNSMESTLNDDVLLPLVDDMLYNRKKACEKINKMYGLNISVDFSSAWKDREEANGNKGKK